MKRNIAVAAAACSFCLTAQAPPTFSDDVMAAMDGFASGAYLKSDSTLAALAFTDTGAVRNPMALALWRQFNPFLTNELDLTRPPRRVNAAPTDPALVARVTAAVPRDAIAEIVARARDTNIVILNEAHSSPRDRAFALQVARALRPLGYRTLAAETFDNGQPESGPSAMERLRQDKVVRFSTGAYTRDPVFARFVREALALGYEPVAYEQTKAQTRPTDGIPEREQAQAENLMNRIFTARPKEKVLIFVGWGHVAEKPARHGDMMALRLKKMTGIDPLTIDQTSVTELSATEAYAAASARIGTRAAVFFEAKSPLLIGPISGVDLQVVHPRRSYRAGRPSWLVALGGRRMPVPKHLLPATRRRLVQAFAADAPRDAVPLDQVLVDKSTVAPSLIVPAGPVRLVVQE